MISGVAEPVATEHLGRNNELSLGRRTASMSAAGLGGRAGAGSVESVIKNKAGAIARLRVWS
jgi:hypothetical protein